MRCEHATRAAEQCAREILSSPSPPTATQHAYDVIPQFRVLAPGLRTTKCEGRQERTQTDTNEKNLQLTVCVRLCPLVSFYQSCWHFCSTRAVSGFAHWFARSPRFRACGPAHMIHIERRRYTTFCDVCAIACVFLHSYIRAWTTGAKRRGNECLIRDVSSCSSPPPRR
jgi:hypothetical protein